MNILVALDFSDASEPILSEAINLAKTIDQGKIYLVHVAAPNPDFVGYDIGPQYIRDARASELKQEHEQLGNYQKQIEDAGIPCTPLLIAGHAAKLISEEANKLNAQYIVIGSHGRSALYEVILGSVTQAVIKAATVPVLVVPSNI